MMDIHPKWEIEEKAIIFRSCVWFSPIHPPMAVDRIAMAVSSAGSSDLEVSSSRVIGGNFMAVDSSRPVVRREPWSTSGNQKWNGTRPSFIEMAVVMTKHAAGCVK